MQMRVAAELQIGEDDHQHMSTSSSIWLNKRSASCKGSARSNHCEIGPKKKISGAGNKASDNGDDASKKKTQQLCLCAPATHAGSFKCRLHRATESTNAATAHKPLALSSTGKKSFSSRNMVESPTGFLDVQSQPRLSRFGKAVVAAAANGVGSQPTK